MKKILITGCNGFVGKNLNEKLRNLSEFDITAVNHSTLNLLDEHCVSQFMGQHHFDVVINCATVGGTRKNAYDADQSDVTYKNLKMYYNIYKHLSPETHLINFGSGAEYDKSKPLHRILETQFDDVIPSDAYGFSKYAISKHIATVDNVTCLRIFGLYGEYEDYSFKFISNSIVKNLSKMPIEINQNVVFDYLYIDDLVKIVAEFSRTKPKDKFINVTPSNSIDLLTIANIINEISDYHSDIKVINNGMNNEYTGSNCVLKQNYKELEFTEYRQGIQELYDYYKNSFKSLDLEAVRKDMYSKYCKVSK